MNDFEALVSLNLIPQIGSACLGRMLGYFSSPGDIFKASFTELSRVAGEKSSRNILSFDMNTLEKDLNCARKSGLKIVTLFDDDYPQILKQIPSAPLVLYIWGCLGREDKCAVAIVGSRRASLYGLSCAEKFAAELSSAGITIVSGLARGVDTYAHRGALKAKGRTIAVLGSGFNHIYPPENKELARKISLSGAVISEFPMDCGPLPFNFPRRNRIISGLSLGVLITEADRNSGALITADFALEQGREVFALPGRVDVNGSRGTNYLIKQGAKLTMNCQDIIDELNLEPVPLKETAGPEPRFAEKEENLLYGLIGREAVSIDELSEKSCLSPNRLHSLILELQLKKLIRELPGKNFMRN